MCRTRARAKPFVALFVKAYQSGYTVAYICGGYAWQMYVRFCFDGMHGTPLSSN